MLLDGKNRLIAIQEEKRRRALHLIRLFIQRKKATVKEIQQLAGLLNFLNRAIVPGRVFMRRMYSKYMHLADNRSQTKLKPFHHINLDAKFRADWRIWEQFLSTKISTVINHLFMDWEKTLLADDLGFYTDASKNPLLGFGCICGTKWTYGQWESNYILKFNPNIEYLELLALCIGVFTWKTSLRNTHLLVHCDNQSVVEMVNSSSSRCKNCMQLLRFLTLNSLQYNTRVFAVHLSSKQNYLSDCLSRLKFKQFFEAAPLGIADFPDPLPAELWPASKIWVY